MTPHPQTLSEHVAALAWPEVALLCALCAVVFAVVLAEEDTPIRPYFQWVENWRDAGGWRSWIASPLGGCAKCTAGQMALWCSIAINGEFSITAALTYAGTASAAVLLAAIISHAYRWLSRQI